MTCVRSSGGAPVSKALKIAVIPPMLSASVAIAIAENAGLRRTCRNL